jgi:cyclin-C
MAANYWTSTQRQFWLFTREKLADIWDDLAERDLAIFQQFGGIPDRRFIRIYLKEQLVRLSKRLATRQQALATCLVYVHRYLVSNPIYTVNPYLLLSTAYYLASKTEEAPHHIRLVIAEARQLWPEFITGDVSRIGEMEFSLISEMRSQLIVWHPYRTLLDLRDNSSLELSTGEVNLAWSIINDSYMTDLPLTCPPHLIAVTALFLAIVLPPNKTSVGPPSLPHSQGMSSLPGSFHSIGGRGGVADDLHNSILGLSQQGIPTTAASDHGKSTECSTDEASIKSQAISAASASERVQRIVRFLAESEVDLEQMAEAIQDMICLYEVWEQYSEKTVKDVLARYIKGRGLDK